MSSKKELVARTLLVGAAMVVALVMTACGPSEEEVQASARAEEWTALQAEHESVLALRADVQAAQEAAAAAAAEAEADADAAEDEGEEAEAAPSPVADLEGQLNAKLDAYSERLVSFINEYAGFEGEDPFPEVKEALRLKSYEDIVLAQEYIDRGGDYAKAVEIMQSALAVDPDNQDLSAKLAEAERLRYMDEERFSQVKKGMLEDEVRAALGQVKHQNVRKYDDRNVTAWFYPREGGAAAAVFYRPDKGVLKVYDMNFDAVKSAAERSE
jgi:tetratricopeptide (TPR) repeat protein